MQITGCKLVKKQKGISSILHVVTTCIAGPLKRTCIVTLNYTGLFKLGEEKNVAQANSTLVVLTTSHKFWCWLLGEFYCTKAIPVSEIQHEKENGEQ